jgi:hypothetical protein
VFQIDGPSDILRLARDLVTLKPVESLGERVELGPRVAAMRLAERRGENPVQAVIDGRNVTVDFNQGGVATKYLNQFILFFNVGFQGPAQIARAALHRPTHRASVNLREFAPFAAAAGEATAKALGDDSHGWAEVAQSVGSGLSPTNSTSLAQLRTEPLAGIPLLPALAQIGMNQDWFRGRTIVSRRADDNASALARGLTPQLRA